VDHGGETIFMAWSLLLELLIPIFYPRYYLIFEHLRRNTSYQRGWKFTVYSWRSYKRRVVYKQTKIDSYCYPVHLLKEEKGHE